MMMMFKKRERLLKSLDNKQTKNLKNNACFFPFLYLYVANDTNTFAVILPSYIKKYCSFHSAMKSLIIIN